MAPRWHPAAAAAAAGACSAAIALSRIAPDSCWRGGCRGNIEPSFMHNLSYNLSGVLPFPLYLWHPQAHPQAPFNRRSSSEA